MLVKLTIVLDVGNQDNTKDALESAKNQMRAMELEEMLDLLCK